MYYVDQRLSKIMSDIRLDQASQIRKKRIAGAGDGRLRQRLGLWLINQGEALAHGKEKAA